MINNIIMVNTQFVRIIKCHYFNKAGPQQKVLNCSTSDIVLICLVIIGR